MPHIILIITILLITQVSNCSSISHSLLQHDDNPTPRNTPIPQSIALCVAIKEKPRYILEWIDYHATLGISTFYLMDTDNPHNSDLAQALSPHIKTGLVELYHLPRVTPQTISLLQVKLYKACLDGIRHKHQFVGFWDVDEYLVPLDTSILLDHNGTLSGFLMDKFRGFGGLAVNWRVVGPSGHVQDPGGGNESDHHHNIHIGLIARQGAHSTRSTSDAPSKTFAARKTSNTSQSMAIPSTILQYTQCTPWTYNENQEIKTIVNTEFAVCPTTDPHTFVYKKGYHAVDFQGKKVDGAKNHAVHDTYVKHGEVPRLALYHYVTRSWEEYQEKMRKGSAMGNRKNDEYFRKIDSLAIERCTEGVDAYRMAASLRNIYERSALYRLHGD